MKTRGILFIRNRRGVAAIYLVIMLTALIGMCSLATDWGHMQLVKTQLRVAADAAARYGVTKISSGVSATRTAAIDAANDNSCDGSAVVINNSDIEFGTWNTTNRTFTVLTGSARTGAKALRVTARRTAANNNATKTAMASALGRNTVDVTAVSIAYFEAGVSIDLDVPETSNPWLAGSPNGTYANPNPPPSGVRRDRAGDYTDSKGVFHDNGESPAQLTGMTLTAGDVLNFDTIAGNGQHGPTQTSVGPDGDTSIGAFQNDAGAENGKSNIWAPIDAVVGVFLDANTPSGTTPTNLDFSTSASRDFTSLSPQLKQVFFIGDGLTSGGTKQNFIVPTGATRLFIGKMDGYEWNNNTGAVTVQIDRPWAVTLVK